MMAASTVAHHPLQGAACWGLVSLVNWEFGGLRLGISSWAPENKPQPCQLSAQRKEELLKGEKMERILNDPSKGQEVWQREGHGRELRQRERTTHVE